MEGGLVSSCPSFCAPCFLYSTGQALRGFISFRLLFLPILHTSPSTLGWPLLLRPEEYQVQAFSHGVLHPSHLPPSPLLHHHIRFLHSFFLLLWRKYLKFMTPKPKPPLSYWYALASWKSKTSFRLHQNFYLFNCNMYLYEQSIHSPNIYYCAALATILEGKKNLYQTKYATSKIIEDICMWAFTLSSIHDTYLVHSSKDCTSICWKELISSRFPIK